MSLASIGVAMVIGVLLVAGIYIGVHLFLEYSAGKTKIGKPVVVPPGVTPWQQHYSNTTDFICDCGRDGTFRGATFTPAIDAGAGFIPQGQCCDYGRPSPEIPARYSVVCVCGIGHFKRAETIKVEWPDGES